MATILASLGVDDDDDDDDDDDKEDDDVSDGRERSKSSCLVLSP